MDETLRELADAADIEFIGGKKEITPPRVSTDKLGNLSIVWEDDQIQAQVNDIDRNRRELSCYLSIREYRDKKVKWICAPVRINLMSSSAKTGLRRELNDRKALDWASRLDQIVVATHKAAAEQRKPGVLASRNDLTEQAWLLEPLLEQAQHSMVVAAGGTGKSLLALAVCASVVTGTQIVSGMQPGEFTGNCLYLDWETDQETHERRLTQICAGAGLPFPEGRVHYIRMAVSLAEDVPYLHEYIVKHNIGLVVNDSVGMATGGDMNSQQDAISYVTACRAIGDVTVLSIHHIGWGDTTRNTGSRYFENAARSVWVLEKNQEANTAESHLDLTHRKSNNGIIKQPIGVRIEFGESIRYYADEVSSEKQTAGAQVQDVLSVGKMALQAIYGELENVEKTAIRKALERMVKSGAVIKWDGTDRKNPEYGLSVTETIRHRDVTDRGSVTDTPSKRGGGLSSLRITPELGDQENEEPNKTYRLPYPDSDGGDDDDPVPHF